MVCRHTRSEVYGTLCQRFNVHKLLATIKTQDVREDLLLAAVEDVLVTDGVAVV